MKKVLFVLGMVAVMSACSGVQKSETVANDSIAVAVDSLSTDSVAVDSVAVDSLIVE